MALILDEVNGIDTPSLRIAGNTVVTLNNNVNSGTAVATTSGTAIDFTGIPSWVKRVTVGLIGFSTNGTSPYLIQIGDSGGIESTGYLGATDSNGTLGAFSNGFAVAAGGSNVVMNGQIILTLIDSATNTWAVSYALGRSDGALVVTGGGVKALTGTLTQLRLTSISADTFDAGSVNILWE